MNVAARHFSDMPIPYALTLDEVTRNLLRHGFTRYYCWSLPSRFPKVIDGFTRLTQSADAKMITIEAARELHQDGKPNLGLRRVERGEVKVDPRPDEVQEGRTKYDETKIYYHGNQRTLGYFAPRQGLVERHANFFLESMLMHSECVVLGHEIADRLDKLLPGYDFAKRLLGREDANLLRVVGYLCDGNVPGIAQLHRDQNFLTIHIRSDRPRLWLADRNDRIVQDAGETKDDSVLIFLSRKAWEITRGVLPGILHGVLDPTFGEVNRSPRHTAVEFIHADVTSDEAQWGKDNGPQLRPAPHLKVFGQADMQVA